MCLPAYHAPLYFSLSKLPISSNCPQPKMALASQGVTVDRALAFLRDPATKDIHKYLYLRFAQQFSPKLFYDILLCHVQEVLPYVYTPTVGEACQYYCNLPIVPQGMRLTLQDKGQILTKLKTWTQPLVKVPLLFYVHQASH